MTFLPFLLNQSKLPICSYYFFLFWPLTLQTLNGSSTVLFSAYQVSPMTFLPFLLNRSKLPICSYYFFLFWPLTLKSVKKKSINACILINKISRSEERRVLFFSILACNTSNT